LDGGAGNDVIAGGTGSDVLTGGRNNDTFIFNTGDGADTITDFDARRGDDVIDLNVDGFNSFADVQAVATQQGGDVVIDLGGTDTIILQNSDLGDLTSDDFLF